MASKPFNIELGVDQQAILERQIELGHFEDASAVVNEALTLLGERDTAFDDWLREEVREALADPRPPIPMEEVFAGLEERHAQRVDGVKRGAK